MHRRLDHHLDQAFIHRDTSAFNYLLYQIFGWPVRVSRKTVQETLEPVYNCIMVAKRIVAQVLN
jgi:hypothetical protein